MQDVQDPPKKKAKEVKSFNEEVVTQQPKEVSDWGEEVTTSPEKKNPLPTTSSTGTTQSVPITSQSNLPKDNTVANTNPQENNSSVLDPKNILSFTNLSDGNVDPLEALAGFHAEKTKELNTQKNILHSQILNIAQDKSVQRGDMQVPKLHLEKPLVPETGVSEEDKVYSQLNDVNEVQKQINNSVRRDASILIADKTKDPVIAGRLVRKVLGDNSADEEQRYADKSLPISPSQQYYNEKQGLDVLQTALDTQYEDKADPNYISQKIDLENQSKNLINKYPEFKQQQIAKAVAQQVMKDHPNATGMMVMPYAKEAAKKLGLSDEEIKSINSDNLPIQGIASSIGGELYNTALKIGAAIGRPLGSAVGISQDYLNAHIGEALKAGEERYSDVSGTQNSPTVVDTDPKSDTYLQDIQNTDKGKYNYNFHTISNAIGSGIGSLVGIVGGTKGFGSIAKSIAPALTEAATADIGMAATMIGQGYEPYYQQARQTISDKPEDEWKRHLYALLKGSIDYAVFKPLGKLQEAISPSAAKELGAILKDAPSLEDVNKKLLTKWTTNVLKGAENTVGETAKIGVAQVGGDIAKNIVDNVVGSPEGKKQSNENLGEHIVSGIENLPFTMMIPLGLGELAKGIKSSNVFRENLYNAGLHPETYLGQANELLQNGKITQDQYNKRAQVINTSKDIVNAIPDDIDLNHNQKVKYVNSKLKELALQVKADKIGDNALEGYYKEKIDNEVKDRISIINGGGKENDFIEPKGEPENITKPLELSTENKTPIEETKPIADFTGKDNNFLANKEPNFFTPEERIKYNELMKVPETEDQAAKMVSDKKGEIKNISEPVPTIESAVIEINGKQYEGKNHAEAILEAKRQNPALDISTIDRKGQGKFKLSNGEIIDREKAKTLFGSDRSEQLIPQDEAAKKADSEFSKLNEPNKEVSTVSDTETAAKNGLPKELSGETQIGSTGFGGNREHTTGKVNLEDLKVLDNGIETAKETLKTDKSFKPSKEAVVVGVDINTGDKQLLDGYHRYVSKDGKGEVNAKFIPMKDGSIISFEEAKKENLQNIKTNTSGGENKQVAVQDTKQSGVDEIDQKEVMRQMQPITDKMADIERQFKNEGLSIDWDYDNEIQVLDKNGEMVDPDEIPDNLKKAAADYEMATQKLGDFDQQSYNQSLVDSRKRIVGEDIPYEEVKKELPPPEPPIDNTGSKEDADSGKVVGMTREIMKQEQIDSNLTDAENLFIGGADKKAWADVNKKIQSNPNLYQERVNKTFGEALNGERPKVSDEDALIGLHEKVKLRIEHNKISEQIADAKLTGDDLSVIPLELQREAIENRQIENKQFIKLVGSSGGKLLRSIGFLSGEDYSFAGLTHEIEREQGSPLTKEQQIKYRKLSEEHAALIKEMNDLQTRIKAEDEIRVRNEEIDRKKFEDDTIARLKAEIKNQKPQKTARTREVVKAELDKARLQFRIDSAQPSSGGLQAIESFVKVVKLAVEYGIKSAADFIKEFKDDLKGYSENEIKDAFDKIANPNNFKALTEKAIGKSGGDLNEGMKGIVDQMLKATVEENPSITHVEATDKIYDALSEGIPDISRDEVRDLISGYGKYKLLNKEQVPTAIREIKTQNRLDAALDAVKEKNELPLRSGMERHEKTEATRKKEAEILKVIKDKGLTPELSAEDIDKQYKSAEASYQKRIENAITDIENEIATGERKQKSAPKEYNSERSKELKADLERLKEIRDAKFNPPKTADEIASGKEKTKEKATQKAIDDINKEIDLLKNGKVPEGEPTVNSKDGKQVFDFKKNQADKITNDRIKELESIKQNLQDEKSNLIPSEIKKQAIILKERANRQRRLENLETQVKEGKYSSNPKPEIKPYDAKVEAVNIKIKNLESIVANEKEKIRLSNRGKVEKIIDNLSKYQRFMIFLNPWGMGRLAYAAMFRPVMRIPVEFAKYALSNLPITSRIMEKSTGMYRPTIGSAARATKNYYSSFIAKKTFKDAASEYNRRSNFSLLHDEKAVDRYSNGLDFTLSAPEMTHGFMKAFPKISAYESTYKAALENLSNSTDPRTGKPYDITDPTVRQIAIEEATREAYADVFMSQSELSNLSNKMLAGMATSENVALQAMGLYGKQLQPVLRVPANFYHEVLQQLPVIGMMDAAQVVARSGEVGAKKLKDGSFRGIENLTPEQAHNAARAMVNQAVGLLMVGVGIVLFKKYEDKIVDKIEEYKYWIHNTGLPLVMMGLGIGKSLEEGKGVVSSIGGQLVHTTVEETTKLPQLKAAAQVTKLSWAAAKAAAGKSNWDGASKQAKEMLATLLIPAGAAELAKRMDDNQKRDPKTFKEVLEMRIPGLRDNVTASSGGYTIEELKSPQIKFFKDRKIDLPGFNPKEIEVESSNKKLSEYSQDKIDKFNTKKITFLKDRIGEYIQDDGEMTDNNVYVNDAGSVSVIEDDKHTIKKELNELNAEQLKKVLKSFGGSATKHAKEWFDENEKNGWEQ